MLRPNAHLQELMLRASREQIETAMDKAKKHMDACRFLEIETEPPERVLTEALTVVLAGDVSDGDAGKARDDLFLKRNYGRNYQEP